MKLRRLLLLLLLLCLLLPCTLTSCGKAKAVEFKDLESYRIVYATRIGTEPFRAIRAMMDKIEDVAGVTLDYGEDFVKTGTDVPTDTLEILIGNTNREESQSYNLGINDFGIWYENDRLVIRGGSDEALIRGIQYFTEEYITEEGVMRPRRRMLSQEEYPYGKTTLNGVDIYDYTIVRDTKSEAIATILRDKIAEKTGAYLKIVGQRAEVTNGYEILVGKFYSEERKSPEVAEGKWTIATVGTRVYMTGDGDDGAYDAILAFFEDIAGSGRKLKLKYETPKTGDVNPIVLFSLNLPKDLPSLENKVGLTMSTQTVMQRFLATRAELPTEVSTVERVLLDNYPASKLNQLFVAPNGRDDAAGTKEAPLATLGEAVARMEDRAGGVIYMMGGTYYTDKAIELKREHSGLRLSPLFIKAWEDEEVILSANQGLSTDETLWSTLSPTANADVYERFPAEARDHIIYTTLAAQGMTAADFAEIDTKKGAPRLFVDGEQYTLARFPNSNEPLDLLYFTQVYNTGTVTSRDGSNLYWDWIKTANQWGYDPTANVGWEIRVPDGPLGEEILSWVNTGDIWYYGSVFEGWEFAYYNLALTAAADIAGGGQEWSHPSPSDPSVPLLGKLKSDGGYSLKSMTYNTYGAKNSGNSPAGRNTFYLFNAVEALDVPGEWFLDRDTGILYLYPTEGFHEARMELTGTEVYNLLSLTAVENVVIDGITVDGATNSGIYISNARKVVVQDVTVRNVRASCVTLANDTTDTAIIHSDFSASSSAMINLSLSSAMRRLAPTNVIVQNCLFHDALPTVQTAVSVGGCRTVVSHNYFHNTTVNTGSAAECIIEYNRFEGGSADVVDGGMVYMGGSTSRGNHVRYNVFHMFRATHNAVYNDGMGSGNYTYGNIISTLGSESNLNKGWYSSTGVGNVCYGNIMVLRNPMQVAAAGSAGGDEGDVVHTGANDQINQSALFYYYFGDSYSKGGDAARCSLVDMKGNPITDAYGRQLVASQSLAGHWWVGNKTKEVELYLKTASTSEWAKRDPAYINHLIGTQLILDAYTETPEADRYHPRYFYAPWTLSGKTYTATVPAFTQILIPEYQYKNAVGELVTVSKEIREADAEGKITLTYEEIAAMERFRRQPSISVIRDNVILGGRATMSGGLYTTEADVSRIITNSAVGYLGYIDTTAVDNNYFHYVYDDVMENAEAHDYVLKESALPGIEAALSDDGYAFVSGLNDWRCGFTYSYDYSKWR